MDSLFYSNLLKHDKAQSNMNIYNVIKVSFICYDFELRKIYEYTAQLTDEFVRTWSIMYGIDDTALFYYTYIKIIKKTFPRIYSQFLIWHAEWVCL